MSVRGVGVSPSYGLLPFGTWLLVVTMLYRPVESVWIVAATIGANLVNSDLF